MDVMLLMCGLVSAVVGEKQSTFENSPPLGEFFFVDFFHAQYHVTFCHRTALFSRLTHSFLYISQDLLHTHQQEIMQQQYGPIINSRKQFLLRGSTKIIVEFFGEKILEKDQLDLTLFWGKQMLINALYTIASTF